VAIAANRNVIQKEAEKKLKYKRLRTEIQRMWNMKCMIIPVVIEATGIVTKGLKKNLEAITGKHSTDSQHKTATLGTQHVTKKVPQPPDCSRRGPQAVLLLSDVMLLF
jgi:hypothetical protein